MEAKISDTTITQKATLMNQAIHQISDHAKKDFIATLVDFGKMKIHGIKQDPGTEEYLRITRENKNYPNLKTEFFTLVLTPVDGDDEEIGEGLLASYNVMKNESPQLFSAVAEAAEKIDDVLDTRSGSVGVFKTDDSNKLKLKKKFYIYDIETKFEFNVWIQSLNDGKGGYRTITDEDTGEEIRATSSSLGLRCLPEGGNLNRVVGREIRRLKKHDTSKAKSGTAEVDEGLETED